MLKIKCHWEVGTFIAVVLFVLFFVITHSIKTPEYDESSKIKERTKRIDVNIYLIYLYLDNKLNNIEYELNNIEYELNKISEDTK